MRFTGLVVSAASLLLAPPTFAHALAARQAPTAPDPATQTASSAHPQAPAPRGGSWSGFEVIRAAMLENPSGLTSDQVAERAKSDAPSVAARDAAIAEIDAGVTATIAQFAPGFSLVASYARLSEAEIDFGGGGGNIVGARNEGPLLVGLCPDGQTMGCVVDSGQLPVVAVPNEGIDFEIPLNNFNLQAKLTLPVTDYILRLKPALRGSQAERKAAQGRRAAEIEQIDLQARLGYYEYVRIVARQVVAAQTLDRVQARLEDARASAAAGLATTADVARLEGRWAATKDSVDQLASFRREAGRGLAIMMGSEVEPYQVGEDVLAPLPNDPRLADPTELVGAALENRPSLEAFRNSKIALGEAEKASRSLFFPRIDGSADFTYANPNQRYFPATDEWNYSWSVGVSLSWQLGQMLNGRAEVQKYRAQISALDANRRQLMRAVRNEVHAAWEGMARARTRIDAQKRVIDSVLPAYEQTVALYRAGEATTSDVIDAEGERLDASSQLVDAHIDLRVAHEKLLHASGLSPAARADARAPERGRTRTQKAAQ